ncbi:MAG: zinc ABC transporter substrate-binding protein [Verrucomicrobiota bacterium]
MYKSKTVLSTVVCLTLVLGSFVTAKPTAVTTTTMITDMVRDVAGDQVNVEPLMGPGVDPHLYKPSASDIQKFNRADIIFYNGHMLEGRMIEIFDSMKKRGKAVYAVGEAVPAGELIDSDEYEGFADPHLWFDPVLWSYCVDVVVEGLSELEPAHAKEFAARGEKLKANLAEYDAWAKERFTSVPQARRILVTSHDAYNYFGRAYEFQVVGVQGISTTTEAGMADVSSTIDFIKDNGIKAIFVETTVSPAVIKRISDDSGATIGGELYSDALGTPGQLESGPDGTSYDVGTWEGMFQHNVNTIVEALK